MDNFEQERLWEMREDMLIEALLRKDDDYFYDYITDRFGSRISELMVDIENECSFYDRDADEWFGILLEK
jgi:hypothetical protein